MVFATLICSLFYCFEFIPNFSDNYINKINEHKQAKKKRTITLEKLKKYVQINNISLYSAYKTEKTNTDIVYNEFKKVKKEEAVFGFKSLQLFATALFPTIAFFFYVLYNLNRSYRVEHKNLGVRIVHYVILMYCIFQFLWIFKTLQDFSKTTYYVATIFSTYFIALAVYILHNQENKLVKKLKSKLFKVSVYSLRYAKEDKKEKMAQIIEEPL